DVNPYGSSYEALDTLSLKHKFEENKETLPSTGDSDTNALTGLGILAFFAAMGLVSKKRRED
ncbi:TPA: LPXTG cell wall anchor domain-containing protein, partial [Streptococcus equi subsp. zooepidemicus]|nr:LPXTG cell wall anchor domain-containing protein [Streptococcus equi subsp. zooepidemicus]